MSEVDHEKYAGKLFLDLITGLTILKKNIGIYPPGHTTISRTTAHLLALLRAVFENAASVTIAASKKTLSINGQAVEAKTQHVQDFALFLNQRGIASLTLEKGVEAEALQQFYLLALSLPPETQLYQRKDLEDQINALAHISVRELDFSSVLLTDDGSSESTIPTGNFTTLWQDFMLACLPPEHQEDRDAVLDDAPANYDRDAFKQFCLKYKVTSSRVLKSYEEMLQRHFFDVEEQPAARSAKQDFFKSMQAALADFSDDLKNQIFSMTLNHMNGIQEEAALEEILMSIPAEMILEALEKASEDKSEISPALTKLLAGMSRAQGQSAGQADAPVQLDAITREQIQKLFSKERYDEYVPEDYADMLQKISAGLLSTAPDRVVCFRMEEHQASLQEDRLNRDIVTALLALMNSEIAAQLYADFSAKIARMVPGLLHAGEYALLVTVYKTFAGHVSHKKDLPVRNAAVAALNAFSQERCISLLAEAFAVQQGQQDTALEELVMLTGSKNLGWLLSLYVQSCSDERGRQLFILLCRFGARAAEEALKILPVSNDEQSIGLLKLIQVCGDNSCILQIRKLLESGNNDLRLEALRTLLKINDPGAVSVLRKMLYVKERRSAEEVLSFIRDNAVQELAPDLALMIDIRFISRDSLLRNKAVLRVLGALGNEKVLPVLHKVAFARFSFTPRSLRETQVCLYRTLGGYSRDAVQELIQSGLRSSSPTIRSLCRAITHAP